MSTMSSEQRSRRDDEEETRAEKLIICNASFGPEEWERVVLVFIMMEGKSL